MTRITEEVSIHAPARGATTPRQALQHVLRFQSTPPRGGRRERGGGLGWRSSFQSTPPRGGRPVMHAALEAGGGFQSTPPRGGRLHARCHRRGRPRAVSIHAPARGATQERRDHAPVDNCFNPRPRAGGDNGARYAPAWAFCFNPRPRAGGDARMVSGDRQRKGFNPRPRAGGDSSRCGSTTSPTSFNPRPRAGGDPGTVTRCCATPKLIVFANLPLMMNPPAVFSPPGFI